MPTFKEITAKLGSKRSDYAMSWAYIANGKREIRDTFFPVSALVEHYHELPWPEDFLNPVNKGRIDGEKIMPSVVAYLQKLGISRIGVFAQGSSSPVFETVPDKEGRCQLITLAGGLDEVIDHPLFVPKQHVGCIRNGDDSMWVIVSPAMNRTSVQTVHVNAVAMGFRDTGLETRDLDKYRAANVVLYKPPAGGRPLEFCVDNGCAFWPEGTTPERKRELLAKARAKFSSHQAVHEKYDGRGLENITLFPPENTSCVALPMAGRKNGGVSAIQKADAKGMTAYELHATGLKALRQARDTNEGGEGWSRRMHEEIDNFDPAQNPNESHHRR